MRSAQWGIRTAIAVMVLCVALFGLALGSISSATASSPLTWSAPTLIAHQEPWISSYPKGVSCPTIGLCVVIDSTGNVITSTDPTGGASTWTVTNIDAKRQIRGISCPSIGLCVAIDEQGDVITSTDPTGGASTWTVTNIDDMNSFEGVSCPSTTLCVAVDNKGNIATSTNPAGGATAWTLTNVDGSAFGFVEGGVSCTSITFCIALDKQGNIVSSTEPSGGRTAWILTKALNSFYEGVDSFRGMSCASTNLCVAFGTVGNYGMIFATSTNPTGGEEAWKVDTTLTTAKINSVTCTTSGFCLAGDNEGDIVTSINPIGGPSTWTTINIDGKNRIEGASCPSTELCVTVDNEGNIMTSTNPTGGAEAWTKVSVDGTNHLTDVSCPSTELCVAVDETGNIVTSTNPAGRNNAWGTINITGYRSFRAVSCPSTTLCVAVGGSTIAVSTNPTGGIGSWNVVEDLEGALDGVSCASDALCVAVDEDGHSVTSTNPTGGTGSWTSTFVDVIDAYHQGPGEGRYHDLSGLSCPSTTLCVASDREGNFLTSSNPTGGAKAWTLTKADGTEPPISVSCPSVGLCVGVNYGGNILTSTNPSGGANAWTVTSNVDTDDNLNRVSCASATFCVATDLEGNIVSSTDPTGGATAWTTSNIEAPNFEGEQQLEGVSCPSTGLCVVVDREGHAIIGTESLQDNLTNGGQKREPDLGNTNNGINNLSGSNVAGGWSGVSSGSTQVSVSATIATQLDGALVHLRCVVTIGSCAPTTLELVVVERLRNGRVIAIAAHHKSIIKQRTTVIGHLTVTLDAGQNAVVVVPLNSTGRKLAKHHKKLTASLRITSRGQTIMSQIVSIPTRRTHK